MSGIAHSRSLAAHAALGQQRKLALGQRGDRMRLSGISPVGCLHGRHRPGRHSLNH